MLGLKQVLKAQNGILVALKRPQIFEKSLGFSGFYILCNSSVHSVNYLTPVLCIHKPLSLQILRVKN